LYIARVGRRCSVIVRGLCPPCLRAARHSGRLAGVGA
jgi:hypothetical protein